MSTMRRTKMKEASQGDFTAQGLTVAEAKANLTEMVTSAIEGTYAPAIVSHGDYSALVTRTPHGWEYRLFCSIDRPINPDGIADTCCGTSMLGNVTRSQAIQSAAGHVVNLDSVDYHTEDQLPTFLTNPKERENVLSCRRFNRAYRWAKANRPDGIGNEDWSFHRWASHNMKNPEFA